jgi:hypothetical protein
LEKLIASQEGKIIQALATGSGFFSLCTNQNNFN